MKHGKELEEPRKSIGIHESTHNALTSMLYDLRVSTYEEAIMRLIVFYEENKV